MHFWINKPAGRYYGFTGRRYPATPIPKARSGQCWHSGEFRQMVTPVHRFQSLGTTGNVAGPSNVNSYRLVPPSIRTDNESRNSSSYNSAQHSQLNNTSNNVTNAGNNQLMLSNNTSNGTNRSLLDFSEFSDAELAGYRLRCGVCIAFILGTALFTAVKFCFGSQGPGFEILLFYVVLTLLLSACLYPVLCRHTQHNSHPEHHIQEDNVTSVTTANTTTAENIRAIPIVRQNSPPPYHIAILIPPPSLSDEAPPPSYDKIVR